MHSLSFYFSLTMKVNLLLLEEMKDREREVPFLLFYPIISNLTIDKVFDVMIYMNISKMTARGYEYNNI